MNFSQYIQSEIQIFNIFSTVLLEKGLKNHKLTFTLPME